jgi:hypothetical protein
MTSAVPVSAIAIEMEDRDDANIGGPTNWSSCWIELVSFALIVGSALSSHRFWQTLFSTADRTVLSVCIAAGLIIAIAQAAWRGNRSKWRIASAVLLWISALVLIGLSFGGEQMELLKQPLVAIGLAFAGWCAVRVRGESLAFALSLGGAIAFPAGIEWMNRTGWNTLIESFAANLTAGLADVSHFFNIREGSNIFFVNGVASRFSSIGELDSVVSFIAVGVFFLLVRRRNLLAAVVTLAVSILVWLAVRAVAWVILLHLGARNGSWYEWSFQMEVGCLIVGCLLIVSLQEFFSELLQPIPLEFSNTEFPLFAMGWNWLCGLPKLTVSMPQRDSDFGPMDEES